MWMITCLQAVVLFGIHFIITIKKESQQGSRKKRIKCKHMTPNFTSSPTIYCHVPVVLNGLLSWREHNYWLENVMLLDVMCSTHTWASNEQQHKWLLQRSWSELKKRRHAAEGTSAVMLTPTWPQFEGEHNTSFEPILLNILQWPEQQQSYTERTTATRTAEREVPLIWLI